MVDQLQVGDAMMPMFHAAVDRIFMDFPKGFLLLPLRPVRQDGKFDAGDINVGYTKVLKVGQWPLLRSPETSVEFRDVPL